MINSCTERQKKKKTIKILHGRGNFGGVQRDFSKPVSETIKLEQCNNIIIILRLACTRLYSTLIIRTRETDIIYGVCDAYQQIKIKGYHNIYARNRRRYLLSYKKNVSGRITRNFTIIVTPWQYTRYNGIAEYVYLTDR